MKYIKILIVLIILIGGGFYFFSNKAEAPQKEQANDASTENIEVNVPLERIGALREPTHDNQIEDIVTPKEIDPEELSASLDSDEVTAREAFFASILDDLDMSAVHDALTRALGDPFYYKKNFYYMLNDFDGDGTRELFVSYATFGADAVQGFAVVDSDGENLIGYPVRIFDGQNGLMIPTQVGDITGDGNKEIWYVDSRSEQPYMEFISISDSGDVSRIQVDGNNGVFESKDWSNGGASYAFGIDEDEDGNDEFVEISNIDNCDYDLKAYEWDGEEFVPASQSLFESLMKKAFSFDYLYELPEGVGSCQ